MSALSRRRALLRREGEPIPAGQPPLQILEAWRGEVAEAGEDATTMFLATSGADDIGPSLRTMRLASIDTGVVFATDRRSAKSAELKSSSRAAVLFYWPQLGRQVRLTGLVGEVDQRQSDELFEQLPGPMKLQSFWTDQSRVVDSRSDVERYKRLAERKHSSITRASEWVAYRLDPDRVEFWQERSDLIHDRHRFVRSAGAWASSRIAP